MKTPPISQILPELKQICLELGLSYDFNTPRYCNREHGCLAAYEEWKQRKGIKTPEKRTYSIVLATTAINRIKKWN